MFFWGKMFETATIAHSVIFYAPRIKPSGVLPVRSARYQSFSRANNPSRSVEGTRYQNICMFFMKILQFMGTFVCIIILAYSKRQQSQYWIATLAISLVYYLFALESPHNGGHTCLPFSRKHSYTNAFFFLSRISNTHRICDIKNDVASEGEHSYLCVSQI